MLLRNGASIEARSPRGLSPLLHGGSSKPNESFVKMLLESGANIEARDRRSDALVLAAQEGHINIVQALLQHGAEANARNWNGHTPVATANASGRKAIVK